MSLRVEENLRMHDAFIMHFAQIRPRQVVKILLAAQHIRAGVVHIQKRLQIGKVVGRAERFHG